MFSFGKNSREKLDTCHKDLVKIFELVIQRTKVDIGISEGHRSKERQHQLYLEGKSKIDGVTELGKHNSTPSEAVDIYIYHSDLSIRRKLVYNKIHMAYIAGIVDSCAKELYNKGEISHLIRWGGNWNSNGVIDFDQSFDDYPHFELIKP